MTFKTCERTQLEHLTWYTKKPKKENTKEDDKETVYLPSDPGGRNSKGHARAEHRPMWGGVETTRFPPGGSSLAFRSSQYEPVNEQGDYHRWVVQSDHVWWEEECIKVIELNLEGERGGCCSMPERC